MSQNLLADWEEQFKKGQLTLWVLLSLLESEKTLEEIINFIKEITQESYEFEAQSLYRALRNFANLKLVTSAEISSNKGPNKKVFSLTRDGKKLLQDFYPRNLKIFSSDNFNLLIKKLYE